MVDFRCLNESHGNGWHAVHGDCVDVVRQMPSNSIDFAVFSPPFSGLYIYNDSAADMGNSANDDEFLTHYQFLAHELFRVMRPGRIVAVHCKDLVFYKNQRGSAGLRDFPGMLVRAHEAAGFTYHAKTTVWRDPVREMTKTKAHGLLYKQLRADSSFSRMGLPEYICFFRKWAKDKKSVSAFSDAYLTEVAAGEDAVWAEIASKEITEIELIRPVTKTKADFPLDWWQETASPVWMTTRETDVLNADRDPTDEKHICPMPLDLTTRATALYTNPGDVVLSPFMGIGSEGFVALKMRRKFVGVELKQTYWKQACRHLATAASGASSLFDAA